MRYRLRTLMILLGVGPPLLAGAWFWSRPFLKPALILLACEFLAAALLLGALFVVGLVLALAKRALWLTGVLQRRGDEP